MTIKLPVTARGEISADAARQNGQLPAVVYGPKQEATSLLVDQRTFEKAYEEGGEASIITLTGLGEDIEVLVQDLAFDPKRGGVIHADFYAIERGKELTTNVPLEFVGEAPVEKTGATVNKILHEVEVTCRPSKLPSHIDVDLTKLDNEEASISIADLTIPEGVTVEDDAEAIVANVSAARKEESEEASEAVDMGAIEVEEKGKTEEAE